MTTSEGIRVVDRVRGEKGVHRHGVGDVACSCKKTKRVKNNKFEH